MKAIARSLVVVFVALIAVPALAVSYTITTAVQLLATTALIMGGTQHPLPARRTTTTSSSHVHGPGRSTTTSFPATPATGSPINSGCRDLPRASSSRCSARRRSTTRLPRVAQSRQLPRGGPCNGGSRTATACLGAPQRTITSSSSATRRAPWSLRSSSKDLIDDPSTDAAPDRHRVLPDRQPDAAQRRHPGSRVRGHDHPVHRHHVLRARPRTVCRGRPARPGDTVDHPTVDVAQQYDFLGGDAPARPLNVLAMANSLAAYAQLHGDVPTHQIGEDGMINQGKYGDTQYYLITSDAYRYSCRCRRSVFPSRSWPSSTRRCGC